TRNIKKRATVPVALFYLLFWLNYFLWHLAQFALSEASKTVVPPKAILPLWQVPQNFPALMSAIVIFTDPSAPGAFIGKGFLSLWHTMHLPEPSLVLCIFPSNVTF